MTDYNATIGLSVVGVFFSNRTIGFGGGPQTTVKDIMDSAQNQFNSNTNTDAWFTYAPMTIGGENIVNSISVYYPGGVTSRSGQFYQPGNYELSQTYTQSAPNPYSVWQYYLFDAAGARIPVPGEQSYTVTKVSDGVRNVASIVWRLVVICNNPTGLARRVQKTIPRDAQTPELF